MRSIWKPYFTFNFLNIKNKFFFTENLPFIKRNQTILKSFISKIFKLYNGKNLKILEIKDFMVGHKFGEFFLTKKKTIFRPKPKYKKK